MPIRLRNVKGKDKWGEINGPLTFTHRAAGVWRHELFTKRTRHWDAQLVEAGPCQVLNQRNRITTRHRIILNHIINSCSDLTGLFLFFSCRLVLVKHYWSVNALLVFLTYSVNCTRSVGAVSPCSGRWNKGHLWPTPHSQSVQRCSYWEALNTINTTQTLQVHSRIIFITLYHVIAVWYWRAQTGQQESGPENRMLLLGQSTRLGHCFRKHLRCCSPSGSTWNTNRLSHNY